MRTLRLHNIYIYSLTLANEDITVAQYIYIYSLTLANEDIMVAQYIYIHLHWQMRTLWLHNIYIFTYTGK